MKEKKVISILLWTARIISICFIVITLIFFIGSLIEGQGKGSPDFDTYTIITFIVWGIGLSGLLFAIWKPGFGGIVSFLSLSIFNLLVALNQNSNYPIILIAFLIPSVLFLISWWLKKTKY